MTKTTQNQNDPHVVETDGTYATVSHDFFDIFSNGEVNVTARFKRPTRQQMKRVQQQAAKNGNRAFETLLLETVHPDDHDTFKAQAEAYPGIVTSFGGLIMTSMGVADLGKQ